METEILKFILSNHGSVNTEELLYNLWDASCLSEIICKNDKFVSCLWNLQPKVVVRSSVTLCWGKDCPGCGRLHLCKNFLLSGSCHLQSRRGCTFSHDLLSDYNEEILREFGLETLTRTELCLLLLQSNNTLLPSICHNYNNRSGCQDDCQRLHICERFLSRDCRCFRPHDFFAPLPLKRLQEKRIPDNLIKILKSVYANKEALRLADRTDDRDNRGNRSNNSDHSDPLAASSSDLTNEYEPNNSSQDSMSAGDTLNTGYDTDSSSDASTNQNKGSGRGVQRRRGRRGGRSRRGNKQQDRTPSHDILDLLESLDASILFVNSEYKQNSLSAAIKPTCTFSNIVTNVTESCERSLNMGKRGTSRGMENNPRTDGPLSHSDLLAAFTSVDVTKVQGPNNNSKNPKPTGKSSNTDAKCNKNQSRGPKGKTEICMFFIKGHCIYEDRCSRAHDKMPYRWEIKQDGQWTPMADNEKIEKDYCDPENTYSILKCLPVYFDIMRCGEDKVRRLSTINSVLKPDYIHTTDWLWYWEDDHGKWHQYAAATCEHRLASITSTELEEMYLKNNKDVVVFTAGSQSYELSFQDMIQTSIKYGTKRLVRRRPRFVSAAEVQTKRKRPENSAAVPDYWDKTLISQTGHMCVSLQSSSGEYKEIQERFCQTMFGFHILKIERIQNKAVWEAFQLQKSHMKNKNGGRPVAEKKLFHGTDPKFINTICATNSHWSLCGVNGTAYGQGSYFACEASYSHCFTGDSDPRFMFVSRVLVGEYTKGCSSYERPPSKDGGDVNLYDSCVDNVMSPSIFVVFEKQQIYPEYLLQYRKWDNVYLNVFSQYGTDATRQTTYHQPAVSTTTAPPASLSATSATTSATKAQSTSATKSQSTSATTSASRSQSASATKSQFTSPTSATTSATKSQFTFLITPATTSATSSQSTSATTSATTFGSRSQPTSVTKSQFTSPTSATTSATKSQFTFLITPATTSATTFGSRSQPTSVTKSQFTFSTTPATMSATRLQSASATTSATRSKSTSATKSQSTSATKSQSTSATKSQSTSATKSQSTSATKSQSTSATTSARRLQSTSATTSARSQSTSATTSARRLQSTSATTSARRLQSTSATTSARRLQSTSATTSARRLQSTSATISARSQSTSATTSATRSQSASATPATKSPSAFSASLISGAPFRFAATTLPPTTSATRSTTASSTTAAKKQKNKTCVIA